MHGIAPIIKDLTIILGVASLVTLLFQYIRQPVVLGYLIAGILIGPHTPPYNIVSDITNIKVIADLGVIFLMFSLGLEFSFHKLARVGFSASITGIIEVSLIATLGFVTAHLLKWSFYDSLFLGASIAISSTTIIIKSLEELRLKTKRFAEIIFGLLIVEDLLAILIIVSLSTVVKTHNIFSIDIIWAAAKLCVVVGSWFLIGYFCVPFFFRNIIQYASQETLTIVSIAFCLMLVLIAVHFDYSAALGAFIMGSILAETPQVERIQQLIRPIRDIFAAVFFVSVGMLIDPKVLLNDLPTVLLVASVMMVGKIVAPSLGALLTGQSFNSALRVGFSMAQIGEFSFIIAGVGMALNATSEKLYSTVVAVSVITTFTGPYLIRLSGQLVSKIEASLSPHAKNYLNNYSAWVYQALADRSDSSTFRKALIRFVTNAILLALAFTLTDQIISPYLSKIIHSHLATVMISWIIALTLSSPFLWAMLFAFKLEALPEQPKNRHALRLQILIIRIMTIAEVSFFSVAYFHNWFIGCLLLLIAISFFILLYARLEKFYQWLEKSFLGNISRNDNKPNPLKLLAPWESHLVHMTMSTESPLAHKTLQECHIRESYNVNIVAIQRDGITKLAPRGTYRLLPYDKIIVLGNDEQLDRFKDILEVSTGPTESTNVLQKLVLKAIFLSPDSEFVGKSIRNSQIRERVNGLVAGLERNGQQKLNPDAGKILQAGDILLMVGEEELLHNL